MALFASLVLAIYIILFVSRHSYVRAVRYSLPITTTTTQLTRRYTLRVQEATTTSSSPQIDTTDLIHYFVRVEGTKFIIRDGNNCAHPFYISGWNQWETMEAAAGALELHGASLPQGVTGPAMVRQILDKAKQQGLNVLRTWGHPVSKEYALASAPGVYNEMVFRGLDYLLDECRKRGIRVLLVLTDNWQPVGGADQFLGWGRGDAMVHEDFFSDPKVKELYKQHVRTFLTRVNTINGIEYRNDPTIFALDLINEPRCYRCGGVLAEWIEEMASWVKSIDSNHLLTVGEEGFYPNHEETGVTERQLVANPQGATSWAFWEGQHFSRDHSSSFIDFTAIHLWIHNWEDPTESFARRWLQQHIADSAVLQKPLLLEEFGAWGAEEFGKQRTAWYKLIYDILAGDVRQGGPTAGALFWQWFGNGQVAPPEEGGSAGGLFGVFDTDETWSEIARFTSFLATTTTTTEMKMMVATTTPSPNTTALVTQFQCPLMSSRTPKKPSSRLVSSFDTKTNDKPLPTPTPPPSSPPDCSHTQIRNLPGTGMEGVHCDIDINECARQTADCHAHAACINTVGGFTCSCFLGYTGDGVRECSARDNSTYLNDIYAAYVTLGPGRVACSEGGDVEYPMAAPGYCDDLMHPESALFGSRMPVGPDECAIACSTAGEACDSFSYNSHHRRCFLKKGASVPVCQKPETLCVSTRGSPYSCGAWQTYFNVSAVKNARQQQQQRWQQEDSGGGGGYGVLQAASVQFNSIKNIKIAPISTKLFNKSTSFLVE